MDPEIRIIKGTGEKVTGEIFFLGEGEIKPELLNQRVEGKIIAGGKFSKVALKKALALDVAGVVTTDVDEDLFNQISAGINWEIGETCHLTLTLLIVEKQDLVFFEKNHGKKAIAPLEEKKIYLCP